MRINVGNKDLYLLMLTSFIFSMSINAVRPIQPLFIIETGATNVELGLILAVSSMVGLVSRIPLSILAEKIGRRTMMMISSLIQSISLASFAFINDVVWFYPIMILQAMVMGLFAPSAVSLAIEMTSLDRIGRVMGLYYTAFGLGQFVGPLLSSLLTNYLNLRYMFLVISIVPLLGLLPQLKSTRNVKKGFVEKKVSKKNRDVMNSFKRILRSRNVIGLCLSRITFSFSAAIIATLLSIWGKNELGFTTSMISILFAARGATNTLIRMPFGRIVDMIGTKKPILLAFSLAAIALLIFSGFTDFTFILIAMCIYGLAWGMRIIPDTAILKTSVRSEDTTLAFAILMSMFAMGSSIGSFVAGATYTVLSMTSIFHMSTVIIVVGIIILAISIKEERR